MDEVTLLRKMNEAMDEVLVEAAASMMRHLYGILQGGSIGRVIWGMYVLLDPANKVVDPDADTLEDHPETLAATKDAQRYRLLRRGQHWSVIDGIGDTLRADELDAAIDAAMAPMQNAALRGGEAVPLD